MDSFDIIRNSGRLLYEYVRGSHLYDLETPDSDVDTSGVFACTREELLGCQGYVPQVSDDRHDNTWFEIGELVRLLLKSNPTVLESLFIPEDKMLVRPAPMMRLLIDNRDKFLTKECFNPFFGYANSQIEKARGLNKKIVNPVTERKTPIDFCHVFEGQGSVCLADWLRKRGLLQEHCGLVGIPNMRDAYGLYYDFGGHIKVYPGWEDDEALLKFAAGIFGYKYAPDAWHHIKTCSFEPLGYRGIIDGNGNDLRLSSVEKDAAPLCHFVFNKDGYTAHCRQYKEYQEWVKNRNPKRYEANLDKNYDAKNMMHCFRLIHMAGEIAQGKSLILRRTWDHDFLMDVRNHNFEYDTVIAMLEEEKEYMNELMAESTIPEKIDREFINNLMVEIRGQQLKLVL